MSGNMLHIWIQCLLVQHQHSVQPMYVKQTGQRTCIMYASTPGNLDTPEGKVAQRIIDNTPPFSEKFYDLTEQEIENMMSAQVDPNDPDKKQVTAVYIEYDWKQLRKTEELGS